MPNPYIFAPDSGGNIWQLSVNDKGVLAALQLPSGTQSPVLAFNVPNIFSASFLLDLSAAPIVQIDQITYNPVYPNGLEIDSQNFQWLITAIFDGSVWRLATSQIGPSGMTRGDIVYAVYGYTEERHTLRRYFTWLDLEINKIIHRQRYWWRRKTADFITYPFIPEYNMVANGIAPDMEQIVNVEELNVGRNPRQLGYIGNSEEVQNVLANMNRGMGRPNGYAIVPGAIQTIRLDPVPNAQYPMRFMYWSGYNPSRVPDEDINIYRDQVIPLIPPSFHYVVLLALQRRSFLMLYGKTDSRFKDIEVELYGADGESGAMGDLDRWNQPSVQAVEDWDTHDRHVYVSSARP